MKYSDEILSILSVAFSAIHASTSPEGAREVSSVHRNVLESIGNRESSLAIADELVPPPSPGSLLFLGELLDDHLVHYLSPQSEYDFVQQSGLECEGLPADPWKLTLREKEILLYLVAGDRSAEIASKCKCARVTVHKHIEHILEKMNVENRGEAACLAREWLEQTS